MNRVAQIKVVPGRRGAYTSYSGAKYCLVLRTEFVSCQSIGA